MTNPDPLGQLRDLPNPAVSFKAITDGVAMPIHRELARDYVIPGRGAEPHGVDNDVPTDEFSTESGSDFVPTEPPEPYNGSPYIAQVDAPDPVDVNVVSMPQQSQLRNTTIRTPFGNKIQYAGTAVLDRSTILQILPHDETRTRAIIKAGRTSDGTALQYAFAIATDGFVSGEYAVLAVAGDNVEFLGKNPVWAAVIGVVAYNAATFNNIQLDVIATRETLLNDVPVGPVTPIRP